VTVGVVMLAHGFQKLFVIGMSGLAGFMADASIPWPMASALAATGAELLGGIALLLGLYTRVAALPVAFTMLVALTVVHWPHGFFLPNGIEYTFTLLAAAIGLALTGPGALALDNRLADHRQSDRVSDLVTRRAA
jgi:putative oxidoreductase